MRLLPLLLSLLLCGASGLNAQDDKEATAKDCERMILEKAANRINPAELMTAQEEAVYAFFDRAEMLINRLANKAAMQNYERYGMKR